MANVTIKEVAQYAGVSRATVSRVLNNHAYVADDVRARVQQAMDALGYQPNRAARRLRAHSSDIMGLIIPDIQNSLFQSLVRGVEDAAYANQLNVVLCNTDDNPEKQKAYLRVMQAERAAGVVVVPTRSNDGAVLAPVREGGIQVVLVDREVVNFEADTVKVDNVRGAYIATTHLINLGYRRIAVIAGTQSLTPGRERLRGCYDAFEEKGLSIDPSRVKVGNFRLESGYELTNELMSMAEPPDAMFVANNLMSLGALRLLHERGIRIPEEVALVGFDDMPWAGDLNPPLTTVSQPGYELGQQAVQLLLQRVERPALPFYKVILQPRLIVRRSCGAYLKGAVPLGLSTSAG
jgi:LacI family transcriptional regulator/LacI family repressor for deo operon, udp, cdd, tsx, nupC, and nupG